MKRKITLFTLCITILSTVLAGQSSSWGDYTLIAVQNQTTATVIDINKQVHHTWTNLTGRTGYPSYLLKDCILLRTVTVSNTTFNGGGVTGRVQKVAKDGTILWDFTYSSSTYCLHHDILQLPNGNILMIAYELKTVNISDLKPHPKNPRNLL